MAPVLFVADTHLAPERPAMVDRFRRFVADEARGASALYVLGDFFEYWLGDDDAADPLNAGLLSELADLARSGVDVAFMRGNRDFLFGGAAAARFGIRLLAEPAVVDLFGVRTVLLHGDTLCTDDLSYQRYRSIVRRPAVQRMFLALPRSMRLAVGRAIRRTSEAHTQFKRPVIMDVNRGAVEKVLREHGFPRLIHGHTHRPARHTHVVDGRACERWVLPDWYDRGGYLRCDERGCEAVGLD
jgi:UDP-2,3-diacylglucosamine hydrolase